LLLELGLDIAVVFIAMRSY